MRTVSKEYWLKLEGDANGFVFPNRVRAKCGNCEAWSVIELENGQTNAAAFLRTASGICPSCGTIFQFLMKYSTEALGGKQKIPVLLFSSCLSDNYLSPPMAGEEVDDRLVKLRQNAATHYNAGRSAEAANTARKVLEGALKRALGDKLVGPSNRASLHSLIDLATQHIDFSEPLKKLAKLAKDAGNFGSHYDEEGEPPLDLVRKQIEVTDFIVSYLLDLPKAIDDMEMQLVKK